MRVHLLWLHVRRRGRLAVTYVYLVLGAAGLAGFKLVHAHYWPWKNCPRCGGKKRNYSLSAHRDCARCNATGRVRRWGAPEERH